MYTQPRTSSDIQETCSQLRKVSQDSTIYEMWRSSPPSSLIISPDRTGTDEPLHRLEPAPVRGSFQRLRKWQSNRSDRTMTVGLYHPTQRTHIQLIISSEVSVVDINFTGNGGNSWEKKMTFHDQYGQIQKEDVDSHGDRTQRRWQVPLCVSHSRSEFTTDSTDFKSIWSHLPVQISRVQQVSFTLLPRVEITLQFCMTSVGSWTLC